ACVSALTSRPNHPGITEAIEAVRRAATAPAGEALAEDRSTFQRLRQTREAAALRHLFFAERQAGRLEGERTEPL
ncbi:hypothetical protein, partial [Microvirga pakistanensis]|uniref:hypothetical protein n=1 Tax=Microvirga pakistanensis TaxID=1682650 RepID=UPI00195DAEF2